ncbi:branched-chain amino acid transport system substrate-binding protein [Streptomyces sp. yr375]|uniref:ABC transporter substrate-binding protein n=1 Tax=Streptomyces sp. yr375 TaxID=1761906 RepID=UPI0008BFEE89|nr:ABC transporter substrate-binding protein [Streptomyces sp. yr375]SER10024.1 branched-chain amino acid transport system substrate-binding protein [Streptomyces sp. yr375]
MRTTTCTPANADLPRRTLLRGVAGAAGLVSASGLLAGCGLVGESSAQSGSRLRIGYVSPSTGSAAGFGEPNVFLLRKLRTAVKDGLRIGGKQYSVAILDRDSQSDPQTAAQVATDLINDKKIDLMLATATPETVNPVADVCEAAKVPCLSTAVPWETWFFGRGATPEKPFTYTYHFFLGVAEIKAAYTSLWTKGGVANNRQVGVLWPDDPDGKAIRQGLGPELKKSGFEIVDPGAYQDGTSDFSAQIEEFKRGDAEIFNSFPLPGDFTAFWQQARQQGYRPRIATLAKTGLVPSQIEALGPLGYGLSAGFWWSPTFPYTSTLTGQTAQQLADDYEQSTHSQWTQILGSNMALFEVALHVLKTTSDPKDRAELAAALGKAKLTTVAGPLDFTSGPVKNVSTEPLVMAQWRKAGSRSGFDVEPVVVDNGAFTDIPLGGELESLR